MGSDLSRLLSLYHDQYTQYNDICSVAHQLGLTTVLLDCFWHGQVVRGQLHAQKRLYYCHLHELPDGACGRSRSYPGCDSLLHLGRLPQFCSH